MSVVNYNFLTKIASFLEKTLFKIEIKIVSLIVYLCIGFSGSRKVIDASIQLKYNYNNYR